VELALYGIVKFAAYSAWGQAGFRLFKTADVSLSRSLGFGAVRWLLGLFLGILVFFLVGTISREDILLHYLVIYTPIRVLEWCVMVAFYFSFSGSGTPSRFVLYWVLGGVAVSFLTDFVSPEMLNGGRFCVGRCLC
jgi:hypothetical protein